MSLLSRGLRSLRTNASHLIGALGSGPRPGGVGGAPLGGVPLGRVGTGLGGTVPGAGLSAVNPAATPLAPGNATFGGVTPMNLSTSNGKLDLGDIGGFLKAHWQDVLGLGVGAYGAYSGAQQAKEGQALQEEALALARQREAELAPLRQVGLAAALNAVQTPVTPYDAAGGYVDAGNPYSVPLAGAPTTGLGGLRPVGAVSRRRRPVG